MNNRSREQQEPWTTR